MMFARKKASFVLLCLGLSVLIWLGLAGCGGGGVNNTPTPDLALMARQTVAVILTQTAVARPIFTPTVPAPTATSTPETATTAQANGTTQGTPKVETAGGVPQEPTRAVKVETPNGNVTVEPFHNPTVEPTQTK